MLYLFAYAFGRHSAAKLVHFSFFVATLGAMLLFGRRYGLWRAAVAGVVLYACSPVVGMDGTVAYNDCALAFYQFLLFYALAVWWGDGEHSWLWVIGVFAGFCFAVKYTGVYAPAAASLLVAAKGPGSEARPQASCRGSGSRGAVRSPLVDQERRRDWESRRSFLQRLVSEPPRHGVLGATLPRADEVLLRGTLNGGVNLCRLLLS